MRISKTITTATKNTLPFHLPEKIKRAYELMNKWLIQTEGKIDMKGLIFPEIMLFGKSRIYEGLLCCK